MDAADRITKVFDRLIALGHTAVLARPFAERVVYFVVVARCDADMNGFSSVFEQALSASDLKVLTDGLRHLKEETLALEFETGLKLLTADGFYDHQNWNKVSDSVKQEIGAIGDRVGDALSALDKKLVALLDSGKDQPKSGGRH